MKLSDLIVTNTKELESITAASPASKTGTLNMNLHHPDAAEESYEIDLPKDEFAGRSISIDL